MPSSSSFKDFVLEQIGGLKNITCKKMMGEYLLYYNSILFGGIYDDRLLVKITNSNKDCGLCQEIPYENAKPMFLVDFLDNKEFLENFITKTCEGLKFIKKT